ncbi:hypothetical protein M3484_05975 [Pseudomonas sp. GX19020]|uniref:hypothetical protein n=1 Tax=Pseudomonas sp. GX19020 TaxID=2942277 RepID=UPI00201A0A9A|nr:hypothetical protein [Pseudomonas sp. GX19020]MCL4066111.1 hypothetical protein [Pseudomonas sp. GX19020]
MPVTAANSEVLRFDRLYIGGEWVLPEEGGLIESIAPSTGSVRALVARAGRGDVDRAVAASWKLGPALAAGCIRSAPICRNPKKCAR